ncbi:MAG: aminotransferase class I/II-fold pyridoxal phosphate-dependent enzyme [Nisaea sp.]|uniref:aminotransferase class I/II-fold pyridoxal phosphate-dependent enzyme n=1 Tax=Nisaea sp. TaxID=2024842 RepID=UPI001B0D5C79|nr:aminotransferase class I/II-fold pyridoxal phosphate-dependent enzyme [Nisaea sp.]MBO6561911.1 aminotransferase class I/II-fold pyridoxal phosphate-dependent enzyme [Nisaea sp.]
MINPALQPLSDYTFARLNRMLEGIEPAAGKRPIMLSVGEPQIQPPAFVNEIIAASGHLWNKYPPPKGDLAFREAVTAWLGRRYGLPTGLLDPERHVTSISGTREALYQLGFLAVPERKNGQQPVILMPNPLYHSYRGAAMLGRAEPVYMNATEENGFLPHLENVAPEILERTALCFLCTPSNPQGRVATLDYLKRAIELARKYDFMLAVDECYAEIYRGDPPPGGLEAAAALGDSLENIVVLHSLSKRSSAPGMRSGFLAGDPELVKRYGEYIMFGSASTPLPILHAATALWKDEAHVEANRAHYAENWRIASRVLGNKKGYHEAEAGFFVCMPSDDAEGLTKTLWREEAVKIVPVGLMAREDTAGVNPGDPFVRIALVYDTETTEEGLRRIAPYF